jgi:hypothetical protein
MTAATDLQGVASAMSTSIDIGSNLAVASLGSQG